MRLCFPLVVLLHGIVANQSDCPMDSDGIQRCSENLVVDDSTALMQNRGFQKQAEMLQLSHLLKQKGVADRSNVASMAGKMRELALNSANGQGVSDEVKNVLVTVKDVQIKAILDSVQSEHDNDLKLLDQARGLIEVCNAVVETEFQTSGGINAQAADSAQKGVALSECRTAEKNALGIKTEKCTDYDLFLTGLQNIPTCAGNLPEPGPKLVKCKKDIEAWSNSYTAASYETKQGDCTTNTNEHAAKKAACDAEQVTFEADYCAYGQLLTTTCAEQTTCFEQEGNAKQQICTNALAAAGLRQTEYIASKKVVCYIDVLVSDDEAAAKKAALQACDTAVDATSLEIACPDTPSKGTCKTDVLLPKPCDDCAECTLASVHPAPVQSVHTVATVGQHSLQPAALEYLIIGGGAGGASGGGGAGGVLHGSDLEPEQSMSILVGAGGSGGTGYGNAKEGGDSSIGSTLTALGGGKGGSLHTRELAGEGGSGGGGGYDSPSVARTSGKTGQGHGGGRSDRGGYGAGGGGGGAGEAGHDAPQTHYGGPGGDGIESSISCTPTWYGGGGGGGVNNNNNRDDDPKSGGKGGKGGGGKGSTAGFGSSNRFTGTNGEDGLGGGGGGTDPESTVAGIGGSGIVIVRYQGGPKFSGGTVSSCQGYTVHTFATVGQHSLASVHPAPVQSVEATDAPAAPAWVKILQYPDRYTPQSAAFGDINSGSYSAAKLADSDINAINSGKSCNGYNYYKFVQEPSKCKGNCQLNVRVPVDVNFADTARSFGWSKQHALANGAEGGPSATYKNANTDSIDTLSIKLTSGNGCDRWFTDYGRAGHCYAGGSGRCFSSGSSCGGHGNRPNVALYKLSGCD